MATLTLNEIHTTNKFFQTSPYNNIESKTANYREQLKQVQANAEFQKEKLDAEWLRERAEKEQSDYLFTLYNNVMEKLKNDENPVRKNPKISDNTQEVNSNQELNIQATASTSSNDRVSNANAILPTSSTSSNARSNGPIQLAQRLEARNRRRRASPAQLSPYSLSAVVTPRDGNTPDQLSPVGTPPSRASISQIDRRQIEEVMRNAGIPAGRRGPVGPVPGSAMIDANPESGSGMRSKKKSKKKNTKSNILM